MLKKRSRIATVIVSLQESDKLDKWAETCLGKKVRECPHLPKKEQEKTYRFQTPELKDEFVRGLKINFGFSAALVR